MQKLINGDQVNLFRTQNFSFFTLENKGWCTAYSVVPPQKVLATELRLPDVPFWNVAPEVQVKPEEEFKAQPYWKFNKISSEEWARVVNLYSHYAFNLKNKSLEVGTFILCSEETLDLVLVVPEQKVTAGSISFENSLGKLATSLDGEKSLLLKEWLVDHHFIGYCHSHNTMKIDTPSSVDDRTEKSMEGIHILLSSFSTNEESCIPNYKICCTYTLHGSRYLVPNETFIEGGGFLEESQYPETTVPLTVLNNVTEVIYPQIKPLKKNTFYSGQNWNFYGNKKEVELPFQDFLVEEGSDLPSLIEDALDKLIRGIILENKKPEKEKEILDLLVLKLQETNWEDTVQESVQIQQSVIDNNLEYFQSVGDDLSAVSYEVLEEVSI